MVDFDGLRDKAEDAAEQHADKVDDTIDKGSDKAGERFGHDEQIDAGADKLKSAIPGEGDGGDNPQ